MQCHLPDALQFLPEAGAGISYTHTLAPITLLDRSHLRLSYLDFELLQNTLPPGRPFHASPSILNEHSAATGSTLLLARLAPDGGLYVVEGVSTGVFVACRLRSWVKESCFGAGAHGTVDSNLLKELCGYENQSGPQAHLTLRNGPSGVCKTSILSPRRPKNRKGILARMSILPKMEIQEPPTTQEEHEPELEGAPSAVFESQTNERFSVDTSISSCLATNMPVPDIRKAPNQSINTQKAERLGHDPDLSRSLDDLLTTQREILLKTLYTTKTALAYFTKSTLARTRANFRSSTTATIYDLADFYRSRLVTSKKMDLKYRDSIPKIVENTSLRELPKNRTVTFPVDAKRKTSRRKKLGKDGLYAGEEDFVRTWWLSRDEWSNDGSSGCSPQYEIQTLLADLRARETELQIVLILETLALESSTQVGCKELASTAAVKQEPNDEESKHILAKTPAKVNKKRDLKPDLDILVDRLCIYQSVSIIDQTTADEAKKKSGESGRDVKNRLRDFCCNVILPFYLHKAPDLVREISRKLGGPNLSPKRPTPFSIGTTSSRLKPGTAVDPRRRSFPRRTLERVLSEDQSSRQPSPPVLMRSSTAPLGVGRNRDSAETSQRPGSRGSLQKSVSFTNREVDLVASSNAHNAKRKKLADLAKQKEELDAAIGALKKPNRSLAGKEIMAEVEKRNVERATSRRNVLGRSSSNENVGVQITATPKRGALLGNASRTGSMLNGPNMGHSQNWERAMPKKCFIPSSTIRGANYRPTQSISQPSNTSTMARQTPYPAVHETPSRSGSRKTSNPLSFPPSIHTFEQPDLPARLYVPPSNLSLVQATPSSNRVRARHSNLSEVEITPLRMTKSQRPVLFMPVQKAEVEVGVVFRDAPIVSEKAGKAMERVMHAGAAGGGGGGGIGKEASIYDTLGWDDDEG